MSDNISSVIQVKIAGKEDFRAIAPVFGIKTPEGPGAMPKRQLLLKVREAVKAGTAELVETDYFGIDAVLNGSGAGTKGKMGNWKISYRVVDAETGKVAGPVMSFEVDKDKIKAVLPDASLVGAKLNAVIALVMVAHREGASIAEFKNYVVTDVARMESETNAGTADEAPKGDDTGEQSSEADKATEVKADVPESVPAETPAKPAPKRTRKPAAKSASK